MAKMDKAKEEQKKETKKKEDVNMPTFSKFPNSSTVQLAVFL